MAARSSKGRTGRGRGSSGSSTRSRAGAARSSRSGGARRNASQGRGGAQSRRRSTSASSRSRRSGGEAETERRRKPASRSQSSQRRTQSRRSSSASSRAGGGRSAQAKSRSGSTGQPRRRTAARSTTSRASRAPRASRRSAADPIAMLTQDHRSVAQLFEQFETAQDAKKKRSLFEKIRNELELHARLEEEVFYPEAETRQELKKELKEAHGEHDKVKQMLREAEGQDPESGEFDATVAGIQGAVEHHVEEEEQQIFPVIRQSFSEDHMKELAQRMQQMRADLQRGNATAGKGRSIVGRLMGR